MGFAAAAPLTFRFVTDSSLGIHTAVAPVAPVAELGEPADFVVVLQGCNMCCSGHPTWFESQVHLAT